MIRKAGKLFVGSALLSLLVSCAPPMNPPPPKWTVENPSAASETEQKPAQAARETKPDIASTSSLDALRSGQSTVSSGPLKDVFFAFDRAQLSDEARATLKANTEWLKSNASVRVQIEGHCDERGTEDYNMALGAKRAQATMDYLASLGISASRMSTISFGKEVPVCREHTEVCWAKNRRARFVIVSGQPAS